VNPDRALKFGWIALAIALAYSRTFFDGDTFFYLATGDWVLDHQRWPGADPFGYNSLPTRWIPHFPLLQLTFALVNRTFGFFGLHLLGTLVGAATLLWLFLRSGAGVLDRIFALAPFGLYLFLAPQFFLLRGQLWGQLFFMVLLLLCFSVRAGNKAAWPVALGLSILWVSCHPSFLLLGLVPAGIALLSLLDARMDRATLKEWAILQAALLVGVVVNPFGPILLIDVIDMLDHVAHSHLRHFMGPPYAENPLWLFMVALGLLAVGLRLTWGEKENQRCDAALLFGLVFATCLASRYAVFLTMVWAMVASSVWLAMAKNLDAHPRVSKLADWEKRNSPRLQLIAGLLLLAVSVGFMANQRDPLGTAPLESELAIRKLDLPDHVLAYSPWGNYLAYKWKGKRKILIDGRVITYADSLYDDYLIIRAALPGYEARLDMYFVNTIVWQSGGALPTALRKSKNWKQVFEKNNQVIFVRARPKGS
jgi:hypothetical protein